MSRVSQVPTSSRTAEEWLLLAVRAKDSETRFTAARAGLALPDLEPDTHVLLERQAYAARLEQHRFRQALVHAERMVAVGKLRDIAYHDQARVHALLGDHDLAIRAQRMAARVAHVERRSFHRWSLASLQHFAGDAEGALATLARAMRSSTRDRPLLKAHALYIRLDSGATERDARSSSEAGSASEVLNALLASPSREGYGRFLLGMISLFRGERAIAREELRAFVDRHENAEPARALTLREELRRARVALGSLDRD